MGIYRTVRIHDMLPKPKRCRPRGARKAALKWHQDTLERAAAAFQHWWREVRFGTGVQIPEEILEDGLKRRRIRPVVGGAWVSKRLLYEAYLFDLALGAELGYWHFLREIRKASPELNQSRHYDLKTYAPRSGILIGRYSESFLWVPGGVRPDFYDTPCLGQRFVVE